MVVLPIIKCRLLLFFALFLNDFEEFMSTRYDGLSNLVQDFVDVAELEELELYHHLYVLLYADDTILLSESPECLQSALSALHDYCALWKLTVNTAKTKVMIFSRGTVQNYPVFFLVVSFLAAFCPLAMCSTQDPTV